MSPKMSKWSGLVRERKIPAPFGAISTFFACTNGMNSFQKLFIFSSVDETSMGFDEKRYYTYQGHVSLKKKTALSTPACR